MKYLIFFLLTTNVFANDLSYQNRENRGETKYERIGKLEDYISKLSSKIGSRNKKIEKDFERKLKELEKKLSKQMEGEIRRVEAKYASLLKVDFSTKKDWNTAMARVDRYQNKFVDLNKKIERLQLEIETLKELIQNQNTD